MAGETVEVTTVTTAGANTLLAGLRRALDGADDALLCVAFVHSQGVHLLQPQLRGLGARGRLLLTTTFATSAAPLVRARGLGMKVAVLNPPSGTYHPKVYAARHGDSATVIVGSANLTGGLVNNVEAAAMMQGRLDDPPIREAWEFAESCWADPRTRAWEHVEPAGDEELFDEVLYVLLGAAVASTKGRFATLGRDPKPNTVTELTRAGMYVETLASRKKRTPPQLIPAWMFSLAWDYLRTHGRLSNRYLLSDDGLNVKRSSAVCAILARLPGVKVEASGGEGIVLRWEG